MRTRRIWLSILWLLGGVTRAVAQPGVVTVSDEMPRVEISVGAAALEQGPGRDFERQFTALGFDAPDGRTKTPHTAPPSLLPGVLAEVHVASGAHTMVGVIISDLKTETEGRAADGGQAVMVAAVLTRGLVVSFRPNPWLKIGAGPALHRRSAGFQGGAETGAEALGWLASGEAKFARGKRAPGRPPAFGYAIAQYHDAPPLSVPAMTTPVIGRTQMSVLTWPPQTVRTSHWMFGLGVGFEI